MSNLCRVCGLEVTLKPHDQSGSTSDVHENCEVTLDEFLEEMAQSLKEFRIEWLSGNKAYPERFPMQFPADNAGAWFEQYLANCENSPQERM